MDDIKINYININDSTSIEEAFKKVTNNSVILFPKGNFTINTQINLDKLKNIKILGYGANINCSITKNSQTEGIEHVTPFFITNCVDISFEGITLNGGVNEFKFNIIYSDDSNSKLIKADNLSGLYFINVCFTGQATNRLNSDKVGRYDSGVLIENSNNILFKNCIYNKNAMEGIWIEKSNNIIIDGLQSTSNKNIWSALNIFECTNADISNCNIVVRNGSFDDTAIVNIYSSNINITNCYLEGGSGLDFSNESNIFQSTQKNLNMNNCIIKCKYGFHQSGDNFIDNVTINNCNINAYYGLYLYHTIHRIIKNIRFLNNTFNVISVLRYRALGNIRLTYNTDSESCDNQLTNINFYNNIIYCKSIADSLKFNPILGPEKGGSVAFVFFDESSNTNGNEIIDNIQIVNNQLYCEGGLILIPTVSKFKINNIYIKDNKIFSSSTDQVKNPIHISNSNYISIKDNTFTDCKCINVFTCNNISIINNIKIYKNTIQEDNGYYIYNASGLVMIKDNISNGTNNEHLKGYQNNFDNYLIENNTPATSIGLIPN